MHPPPEPPARERLEALTGLRFLAAFHVVLFHVARWEGWPGPSAVRHVVGAGYVAVGLFFMLSGFVLTYAQGGREWGPGERRPFYAARFARLYPVYALGLGLSLPFALSAALARGGVGPFLTEGLAVATLLQSWHPGLALAWNAPGWSLSVETFFYAVFPFVAPWLVALPVRRTVAFMGGCLAVLWMVPVAWGLGSAEGWSARYDTEGFWLDFLRYHPLVRLPEFLLGICLGRLYGHGPLRAAVARHAGALALGASMLVLGVLTLGPRVPYVLLHNGLLAPAFGVLLLALATGEGGLSRLLRHRALVGLGEASYSLYVLHIPLLMGSRALVGRVLGREVLDTPSFLVAFLGVAMATSLVSHRFVEQPLNRRLRRLFESRGQAGGAPASAPAGRS